MTDRPNILLVVSDQERQRSWLPPTVSLPNRERLIADGLEFTNHWTHSSPCSPSRATMMTGQYVPQHAVCDNVIHEHHTPLDPGIPTVGRMLRDAGYRSSYIGKWHLSYGATPDMVSYGYADWEGDDRHFMGWAGTGVYYDPIIAENAAHWLRENATGGDEPWFLTVALVNPHDVMWYPIDQPWYQDQHDEEVDFVRQLLAAAAWKDGEPIPAYERDYPRIVDRLPDNFGDDLVTKPGTHRQWRWDQQHGFWGTIDPHDTDQWLRALDYYVELHRLGDRNLGTVLDALDATGTYDDTVILFTSDHGDMCGSHGLRSKGPFVYDEIMRVPLYAKVPGMTTPGAVTDALSSSADLVPTICALAGVEPAETVKGVDLSGVLANPSSAEAREHVLFAMDSAHTTNIRHTRYAVRGFFDGRFKYARYYGFGGGKPNDDPFNEHPGSKLYGADAAFEDQEHELYDLSEDPNELVNLAMDPARNDEVRRRFAELRAIEADAFA